MRLNILLAIFGVSCFGTVLAEKGHELKRGTYPYMAFIYYADTSVTDTTGERFVRAGVLIREDWLVTSAMGQTLINPTNGLQRKTLLARAGAIAIDANFTLNEDEDEQEREVIQVVRPYNHSATQWWTTDISLMKMLFPFNMTLAVGVKTLNIKHTFKAKTCHILVYAKRNKTDDKNLMLLYVDLLSPSIENCGSHFVAATMVCAADSTEKKTTKHDKLFCHGNSGGPLICEDEVMGLQTYIGNDCEQPHLYQLLSAWDNFITCGIEDKCKEEECGNICDVTYKDIPMETRKASIKPKTTSTTTSTATAEKKTKMTKKEQLGTTTSTLSTSKESQYVEETTKTKIINIFASEIDIETTATSGIEKFTTRTVSGDLEVRAWPKEASSVYPSTKELNEEINYEREAEREAAEIAAQHHAIVVARRGRSDSSRNICFIRILYLGFLILACM